MSADSFLAGAMDRAAAIPIACCRCPARGIALRAHALPAGWDALFLPDIGPVFFCPDCAAGGQVEIERAARTLPRRQRWAMPRAVLALYRPAAREVLIATPDGMAALAEADAERLRDALDGALATRALAETMTDPAGPTDPERPVGEGGLQTPRARDACLEPSPEQTTA